MAIFGLWGETSRPSRAMFCCGLVLLCSFCFVSAATGDELVFSVPSMLPGDTALSSSAGMQVEADLSRGGSQYLAVWSDGRSTPDDYWPFATEGSGTDIYGARLDAAGNMIDECPFVIDQTYGDQKEPRVAWNGENWLVIYESPVDSYYDAELRAVRIAPDGTVLDDPALVLDTAGYWYNGSYAVEGGDGEWVALVQDSGPLFAIRVSGGGAVLNPGGLMVHDASGLLDFDIAFATDEYFIVWESAFDPPQGRRFTPTLQLIGTSILPFAQSVATDGNDFLVIAAHGRSPLATVDAVVVTHGGTVLAPFNLYAPGGQAGTCCADAVWDGNHYWTSWGGPRLARVTPTGQVLDPGGVPLIPAEGIIAFPRFQPAAGGGLQVVYNHSNTGSHDPKDIYAGRVSDTVQLENVKVTSSGTPAQLEADFAAGDGTHLIVFISRVSESGRILAQRIDATGTALDAEPIEVATGPIPGPGNGLPSLGAPAAAWNGSVFMITWSDGLQIYARRMLPDGSFVDATPLTVMDGHDPDVAAAGQVFLVVGLDFLFDNIQWQATHSMRVDGVTGANLDADPNALGGFAIYARHPHVVSWGDRWLAVWQRNISHDETIAGTTAAIVLADGTTPELIDVPLGWRPDVAVSEDRALFVAVTHTIASATTDMAGQIMASDGTFVGEAFYISTAAGKQLRPAVSWNGTDFVVAWEDKRNAVIYFDQRTDIYGSRVTTDGTVLDPDGVPLLATAVPEIQPAMLSIGNSTLLAVSTFRPEGQLGAYRIGIQLDTNQPTAVPQPSSAIAAGIRVLGARPNPANPSTVIRFETDARLPVSVRVFDASGRLVRTLVEAQMFDAAPGPVEVRWDGRDDKGREVASGIFFYEVTTPTAAASGKVTILK